MRKLIILSAILILAALAGCGGNGADGGADDEILVRVGKHVVSREDLEAELNRIPPFQRTQFESPEGKQKLLERLVEMRLLYLAGLAEGLDKSPELREELERAQEQIIMRHYYKDYIEAKAEPGDDLVQEYYDGHLDEFAVKERLRARMIMAADREAARALAERLGAGEDFASLARGESKDGATSAEDGDLGWFTEDGYIRSIGVKPELAALIFAQTDGQVGEPIEVEGRGWALFKVEEREAAHQKTMEEARGDIARRLGPKFQETYFKERMEELKERFGVEYAQPDFGQASSPEELFELAQGAKDPHERIGYYEQIVERFRDNEQADRAQFMIGFVYSEELRDNAAAEAAFKRFLELYPESDLGEDARYMLDAMAGNEPEFETGD